MSAVKFKVGASLDANIGAVFVPLEKAAEKARAKIQGTLGAALGGGGGHPYRSNARSITEAFDTASSGAKRSARVTAQSIEGIRKQFENYAKTARKDLDLSHVAAAAESELRKIERQAARTRLAFGGGGGLSFEGGGAIGIGRRAGIRVSRASAALYGYGGAALSGTVGLGGTVLRGIGVNTDISSMVEQGVSQEDLARKIINSAPEYNRAGVGDRRAAAADTLKQIQGVANDTATDTGEALEGLEAFVAKTGDLSTGRDVMGSLARLSRATGTSLADMANAAAEVSNNLGNVPDKGKAIDAVMRSIAGQGKLGAVEIKDLASQMAKVASQAGAFEGDRAKNIAILGAIAQEAKLTGGGASAQQATTSVTSLVASLRTPAAIKRWSKAMVLNKKTGQMEGLNPYTDANHTVLRGPEELILEALNYSKGDQGKFFGLFGGKLSSRAVGGFQQIYSDAGKGLTGEAANKAGMDAVHAEFQRFAQAAMTADDVTNAFAAQMETTKSQVQIFNNEMAQTAQQLAGELLPAFKDLAPLVVSASKALANAADSFFGTKAPREQQEAISTEITAIEDRGKVRRSITVDPKTGQMTMPEEGKTLLEGDAAKLQEKLDRQKQIVAEDHATASGLGDRLHNAHGFIDTLAAPSVWLGDVVSGKQSAAKDKERVDQGELKSIEQNRDKTNDLLGQIRDALNGPLKLVPAVQPPQPTPGGTMPPNSPPP